jgi:sn-glycerol 3-phosphate transport system ATP-binding protein
MASIRLEKVTKQFAAQTVVDDLDLEICDGEFLVLVGPSGCGKSTLLRLLAGLEAITHGRILQDGHDISALPPRDRNFAMIFQNYALFPHMTVEENITFGMRIRHEPRHQHSARVQRVAQLLQLDDLLQRKPAKLSGGQRQRVAMARAIVREPSLFLMDEPLSNLDARLRSEVRDGIMALHRQFRTSTVYVTHDQMEAMTMADRIAVLDQGQLQQIGTPQALYSRPANLFVAGFIGDPAMNIFRLPCHSERVQIGAQSLPLPGPMPATGEVFIGIRPEHLQLTSPAGEDVFSLNVTFADSELLGAEYLVSASSTIGNLRFLQANQRHGRIPELPTPGSSGQLYFSLSDVHFFAGDSQLNLYQERQYA